MGRYQLENERIAIAVDSHGGEMKSLVKKETGTEYLWQADPQYWGRSAPVLFPFVGSVNGGSFRTKGVSYPMGQHGFARDMEFEMELQTEDEIWFVLRSDEETRAKYPYEFALKLGYRLCDGGSGVEVIWRVENPGEEELPFSIGGHPAFYCPIKEGIKQTDCWIKLDTDEKIVSTRISGGLASAEKDVYELQEGYLQVTDHLFDKDALIIEDQHIKKVELCDENRQPYLTVDMNAPLFGIWSPPGKNAPFICIEPWYGRCDPTGFDGELKAREWGNILASGAAWEARFTITV
jgi:galactose mutarotase-like enzyme